MGGRFNRGESVGFKIPARSSLDQSRRSTPWRSTDNGGLLYFALYDFCSWVDSWGGPIIFCLLISN